MTAGAGTGTAGRLDLRGLEPPEPMRLALDAVERLEKGETVEIVTDREPALLHRELERRGHGFATRNVDGDCLTVIRRGLT
ncbi:MAG: DUF2249 domain-containing protein [Alphaproteobacteria bacterium]|nr:DUF2249 domain-containing protein [Alphaproteobacteria bacterium]MDE2013762.1 DUF2249 domain-containing protein [Alphaproteobacteria bacterium]MDE2073588.1 DUF2249 domain-containing protein [Alphaproteobacteria bacterium]MDE2350786.1 DUF2249 domain-containing protein [Alphaproteobacteria bacterium]